MVTSANQPFIAATGLVKLFKVADLEVVALQGLDLAINRGEILAIVGPSGCGKSTFLNILGALDRPSAGQLDVDGRDLLKLSQAELTRYRREEVGFVWQQTSRNLLPYLSGRENIELLMTLAGTGAKQRRAWADELLAAVDLIDVADRRLRELSGGQQQRIALACALANRPRILLADEPTGEVDWPNAERILGMLHELRARYGITVVLVTHDERVADQADRAVLMRDGRLSSERSRSTGETPPTANQPIAPQAPEQLVVIDRTGRLQLSDEQRALAGLGRLARVELVDGAIVIRPETEGVAEPAPAAEPLDLPYDLADQVAPLTEELPAVELAGVERTFMHGSQPIYALRGITMQIRRGSLVVLMGPSGSGKTTLLNQIGALDQPTAGSVTLDRQRLEGLSVRQLAELRRGIGYIFQSFALLPTSSAYENVEVGLRIAGRRPRAEWDARIRRCLAILDLVEWRSHRPYELSGGQQQRVAIARALSAQPTLILADEPTGDLDSQNGRRVLQLLRSLADEQRVTIVVATHDPAAIEFATDFYRLRDGQIEHYEARA